MTVSFRLRALSTLLVLAIVGCEVADTMPAPALQASNNAPVKAITLLNVSYDPTREFYQEYNAAFAKHWLAEQICQPQ